MSKRSSPSTGGKPKRAQGSSAPITVASTGIAVGERVRVATQTGWRGSQFVLVRGEIPPCTEELEAHRKEDPDDGEATFFQRLHAAVSHRPGMESEQAVRAWFTSAARERIGSADAMESDDADEEEDPRVPSTRKYNFMTQVEGDVCIRMEALAGDKVQDASVITDEALAGLVGAELSPMDALLRFSPASEHSAGTHTHRLLFILAYWSLVVPERIDDQPLTATVYSVTPGAIEFRRVMDLDDDQRRQLVPLVQGEARAYVLMPFEQTACSLTPTGMLQMAERQFLALEPCAPAFLDLVRRLKLPIIKSLVQKILRARPLRVRASETLTIAADQALVLCILAALPLSSFNPHGGGVESGLFAMLKRVGVIIPVEDAWTGDAPTVAANACLAAVASRRPEWQPPAALVTALLQQAVAAWSSGVALAWSTTPPPPACVPSLASTSTAEHLLAHTSFVVETFLGGMSGDIAMLRAVARKVTPAPALSPQCTWTMPIEHCIDQHCATTIAYLVPGDAQSAELIRNSKNASHPMAPLFRSLFTTVSGRNPRREPVDWAAEGPLALEFRAAQAAYWPMLLAPPLEPPSPSSPIQPWQVCLPYSWLAYAVGSRTIRMFGAQWVWNLNPDALDDVRAAPRVEKSTLKVAEPSQADSNAELQDEKKRDAVKAEARRLLRVGVFATLSGAEVRVRWRDEDSTYLVAGRPWEEARMRSVDVPTGHWEQDPWCMDRDHGAKALAALAAVPQLGGAGRRLAIALLRSFREEIEFPRPDRDGGAGRQGDALPSPLQWDACRAWAALSRLCPLVVRPDPRNPARFSTPSALLPLRHLIAAELDRRDAPLVIPEGISAQQLGDLALRQVEAEFVAAVGKELRQHQRAVLQQLVQRVVGRSAMRSHFVWLDVGGGKTYVALLFYALLRRLRGLRPDDDFVCLFATSRTAHATVQQDARKLALPVHSFDRPAQASSIALVRRGVVFAHHDTLKSQETLNALLPMMGHTLFVLDEAHLAMGKSTIRTGGMQFLARAASDSLLMTATPLRNTREESVLREWMQMAVSFPCTESRSAFQVALNSMLFHPLYDRVATHEQLVACGDDDAAVKEHIPKRMGGASDAHKFTHEMARWAYAAACTAVDRKMVELVKAKLAEGRRVWVVCENAAHVERMRTALALDPATVWAWSAGDVVRSMPAGAALPYRVGLVPIRISTGYSATHFNVRIRGVYPSNEADRAQIDGRIARYGQPVQPVQLLTVHAGITTLMLNMHINAANFIRMIEALNE